MASSSEKTSYEIIEMEILGSGAREGFMEQQQFHKEVSSQNTKCSKGKEKAVEEFDTVTPNNVLAPVPLRCIPLETGLGFEQQTEGSSGNQSTTGETVIMQQSLLANGHTSKRKRMTEGNDEEIFFRLFKYLNDGEQYILEIHEIRSGDVESYHVMLENKSGGKWSVGIYDLDEIEHSVYLMEVDPNPPIFHKKYDLSLMERLSGWTLEKRKRSNGKEDKFYYHQSRQFRSLVEVTGFILYSSKPKDLIPVTTMIKVSEQLEEEAARTMLMISSVEGFDNLPQRLNNGAQNEIGNPSHEVTDAEKQCNILSAEKDINGCLIIEDSGEKTLQDMLENSKESNSVSHASADESKETQDTSERNKNDNMDTEEQFHDFLNKVFEDLDKSMKE